MQRMVRKQPRLMNILDKNIRDYLPKGQNSELLLDMMKRSREFSERPSGKSKPYKARIASGILRMVLGRRQKAKFNTV